MSDNLSPVGVPRIFGDVPPFMGFAYQPDPLALDADAVVLGMPYDGIATFRGGATRRAPQEIRKYSLLYGDYSFDWDLKLSDALRICDAGDIDVVPGDNLASYARYQARLEAILDRGAIPFSIGGDHGISFPAVSAVSAAGAGPLGLIVFDTHLDLSEEFGGDRLTRASPLLRITELAGIDPHRIVVIGARGPRNLPEWTPLYRQLGITVYSMEEVERLGIETVAARARDRVTAGGARLYVSVDIDGIDPAFAPATNSPESGGLTAREIIRALRIVARDGFAGFDLVEVSPDFDTASGTTSVLAARLIAEALFTLAAARLDCRDRWRTVHRGAD